MIQLKQGFFLIDDGTQAKVPCSAEDITIELIGETSKLTDPHLIEQMIEAVLHYFKNELNRDTVTVEEFVVALKRVFQAVGIEISVEGKASIHQPLPSLRQELLDLKALVQTPGAVMELAIFSQLRQELHRRLDSSPQLLHFTGLREFVKLTLGAKKWNRRCQELNDQVVYFLRDCLANEALNRNCALVIE